VKGLVHVADKVHEELERFLRQRVGASDTGSHKVLEDAGDVLDTAQNVSALAPDPATLSGERAGVRGCAM
jgi:hypothetical protein